MQKLLALIVSIFMLVVIIGCNGSNENMLSGGVIADNDSVSTIVSNNYSISEEKTTQLENILSQYVDLSLYDKTSNEYDIEYELQNATSCNISSSDINIDGDTLTVPFSYNDLVSKGWECANNIEQVVNASSTGYIITTYPSVLPRFYNSNGLEIYTTFCNYTNEEKALKDCTGIGVSFDCAKEDGERVDFSISGITDEDNLCNVISKIGTPRLIVYNISDNDITVYFNSSDDNTSMYFKAIMTGEITEVSYTKKAPK